MFLPSHFSFTTLRCKYLRWSKIYRSLTKRSDAQPAIVAFSPPFLTHSRSFLGIWMSLQFLVMWLESWVLWWYWSQMLSGRCLLIILYVITDRSNFISCSTVNQLWDQLSFILALSMIDRALSCRRWREFHVDFGRLSQITLAYRRWLSTRARYTWSSLDCGIRFSSFF